jgi:hypothetical protein
MTSGVFGVLPKGWVSSPMVDIPIAGFKFPRELPVSKFLVPPTKGELVEISSGPVLVANLRGSNERLSSTGCGFKSCRRAIKKSEKIS